MEKYNYLENVKEDVRNFIEEQLNDMLWNDDTVTGNETGSYFCNTDRAAEAIAFNWDLLKEALDEFGYENIKNGANCCDVLIRCYILPQAIAEVLDEICE